jgi:hypothetical protein
MEVKEESILRVISFGLIILLILVVFAGVIKPLIVAEGIEVELDTVLYNMFLATSLGFFSIAFINQGLAENNNIIRIICFTCGFIITVSTVFGVNLLLSGTLAGLGAVLVAEIFLILAFAFMLATAGIYLIRRA